MNKRNDLLMFIQKDEPDILLITEVIPKSQVNPITDALLKVDGYEYYLNFNCNDSNLGRAGIRGAAIYYKETMVVEEIKFSVNECCDHVWVEIPTDKNAVLLCGCVYRSLANDANINECIQSTKGISQLIRTAYHRNPNLLIAGDFNYKGVDWKNEHAPREQHFMLDFINTIQKCSLFQHVTGRTLQI